METSIIVALISLLGTIIVGGLSYITNRNIKKLLKQNEFIKALKQEVKARQFEEDIACEMIAIRDCKNIMTVKKELRKAVADKHGIRPTMSPSDIR